MHATRTSQAQMETIVCQSRDMLLYSGLEDAKWAETRIIAAAG
jgi:hypothetical protein